MGKRRGLGARLGALGVVFGISVGFSTACEGDSSNKRKTNAGDAGQCEAREDCEATGGTSGGVRECCDGQCVEGNLGECRDAADCGGYACERLDPNDCLGRCTGGFGGNSGSGGAGVGGATAGAGGTSGGTGGNASGGIGGNAAGGAAGSSAGSGGSAGAAGMSTGGSAGQSTGGAAGMSVGGASTGGAAGSGAGGTAGTAGMSSGGSAGSGTGGTATGGSASGGTSGSGGSMGGEGDPCTQNSDCNNVCATGSGSPPQTHVYSQICQGNKCQRHGRLETCGLKCNGQQLMQTVCSAGACQLDSQVEDCSTKLYGAGEAGCYQCADLSPSRCQLQSSNGVWGAWVPAVFGDEKYGSCSVSDPKLVWHKHYCDNPAPTCGGIWCYWTTGAPGGPNAANQPEFRCGPPPP
ncbi:MAG: hypothetical protein R3B07_20005 [Polyangiaceae bacterium]